MLARLAVGGDDARVSRSALACVCTRGRGVF